MLIGTNSVAAAAGNVRCDTVYLAPPAASGAAYLERVAEVIEHERPDLVIPCRDDDVLALAVLGEQSPKVHPVLLSGSVAAARIINDKLETARFAARHGLPFAPTTADVREALTFAETYGLPLIGKPRSGNASRGVVLLRSVEEIERAFERSPDLLVQPFLDPPPDMDELIAPFGAGLPLFFSFPEGGHYTVQSAVGLDGAISDPFACVDRAVGGHGIDSRRCDDVGLLEICRAYARAIAAEGWKGLLNVQLKRTSAGNFVAFELNGRVTGTTAARALLGFDDIGEVVRRFLPGVDFPALPPCEADLAQRYLHSYAVPREAVVALQKGGRWPCAT